jgi:glycosyltransferase involved in cell wall biosynthesis
MPEEHFLMVFPGKSELKRDVLKRSEALDNLEVVDFVDPSKIQQTYNQAKCLVSTSTTEGFPNSFVQAFMGGTPVVSLHVDPDGILSKYDIGRCCNGKLSLAEDFIRSLTIERMEQLFSNCRAYFKDNHDIATVIKQYEDLFAAIPTR